jgi:ABC-type polysaccharide/polyol phosphate transport system ATPase subunit
MMPAVSLEGVSKRYRILSSQRDRLKSILTFGKSKAGRDFWALKNVNLEVEPGTAIGILGRNGAGKSTLLTIISGVSQPTSGKVRVNGRLVALLQLGAGFNDEFTGRENIMLNGLILGIERKEMLERFDEIAAFADIGEFIDQPLKTYSSGMRARLGFAVAVNVKPDILLVDESLSTGDAVFKDKGIKKMEELRDSGVTILFVSHSTQQVRDFCNEAALLHKGRLISCGDTSEVIERYQALISRAAAKRKNRRGLDQPPDYKTAQDGELGTPDLKNLVLDDGSSSLHQSPGDARIQKVELLDDYGRPVDMIATDSNLTVRVHLHYMETIDDSLVDIFLRNDFGLDIFSTNTTLERAPLGRRHAGERVIVDFTIQVPLKHGRYTVVAGVSHSGSRDSDLDLYGDTATFEVARPSDEYASAGLVHLPTQVKLLEPERAQKRESSAGRE